MQHVLLKEGSYSLSIADQENEYCRTYLCSENDEAPKKIKKMITRAMKDDSIFLFIEVPDELSVWEYSREMEEHYFDHMGWHLDRSISVGKKNEKITSLLLGEPILFKLDNSEDMFDVPIYSFTAGILFPDQDGGWRPVRPDKKGCNYYLFTNEKNNEHFKSEDGSKDLQAISVSDNNLSIVIDITKVKDFKGMSADYPELFCLPQRIQEKLAVLPAIYDNLSARLKLLRNAYQKFWLKNYPWENLDESKLISIQREVQKYIHSALTDEDIVSGPYLGVSFAKEAASFILPDCFKLDNGVPRVKSEVLLASGHVPRKYWVLHCLTEPFVENVQKDQLYKKSDINNFKKILFAFNKPKKLDSLSDHQKIILDLFAMRNPEVLYFRDIEFSKDEVEAASKLCLPKGSKK